MDKTPDNTGLQSSYGATTPQSYDSSHEPASNVAPTPEVSECEPITSSDNRSVESGCVDELLQVDLWQPSEPQYCKAVAEHYGVSRRTVQKWFQRLLKLCPWFAESELQLSDDRYTPLAVELMGECYLSGSAKQWAEQVSERFAHVPISDLSSLSPAGAEAESAIVPWQIEVMDIEGLHQQQQAQSQALTLRQQATTALSEANQARLVELHEFFAHQQTQRQTDQTQRQAQLEAEAQNEAIEEFLIKQQAKNAVLSQLEQLNSLGKLTAAPTASPAG